MFQLCHGGDFSTAFPTSLYPALYTFLSTAYQQNGSFYVYYEDNKKLLTGFDGVRSCICSSSVVISSHISTRIGCVGSEDKLYVV